MNAVEYAVIATVQSGDNAPVEIKWYRGTDPLKAMLAVGQALEIDPEDAPVRVSLLGVRVDVQSLNDSTNTPITERGIAGPCGKCGAAVYDVGLILPFNADGSVHGDCTTFKITRVQ